MENSKEEVLEKEVDFFHFSVIMASLAISFRSINNNSSSRWDRNRGKVMD